MKKAIISIVIGIALAGSALAQSKTTVSSLTATGQVGVSIDIVEVLRVSVTRDIEFGQVDRGVGTVTMDGNGNVTGGSNATNAVGTYGIVSITGYPNAPLSVTGLTSNQPSGLSFVGSIHNNSGGVLTSPTLDSKGNLTIRVAGSVSGITNATTLGEHTGEYQITVQYTGV